MPSKRCDAVALSTLRAETTPACAWLLAFTVPTGVQGIAALVSALPVGWLGDKLPRSRITAAGGALQLAATATCALYVRHTGPLWVLLLSLLLWGVVNTCSYGPLQALYADSVPTGQRSR